MMYFPSTIIPGGTAWNPADQTNITLTNGNKTATAPVAGIASVRSTQSRTTGMLCEEFQLTALTPVTSVGLASSGFNLGSILGAGAFSIAVTPNSYAGTQAIIYNGTVISSHAGSASSAGEYVDICENFSTDVLFYTTTAMRAALGSTAWNNSGTCNPTLSCGISFSGLAGPWLLAANSAIVESQDGTTVTSVGPSINASPTPGSPGSGNLVTLTSTGQVAVNGTPIGVTVITPGVGTFTDGSGNVFAIISTNGSITENGTVLAGSNGTSKGEYCNGLSYFQDASSLAWYIWNGSTFVATTAPTCTGTSGVIEEYYRNHTAYQEATGSTWFGPIVAGSGGTSVANPVTGVSPVQPQIVMNTVGPMDVPLPTGYNMWDTATGVIPASEIIAVTIQ
jgi:hypothetical protein